MDVFSLIKFWRNAGVGDHINPGDLDITDDEGSFFELVFDSSSVNVISDHYQQCSKLDGADNLKSNHTLFFNVKRKILPLDASSNSKTPRSPFRVFMLGFHNNNIKSDKKEMMKCEVEDVTIGSLLKQDTNNKLDHHQIPPSKRFISKDVVHRYLNLIKVKVSRTSRSNDKHSPMFSFSPRKELEKPSVFKEVRKHLGKSRSSSSSSNAVKPFPSPRRDDSVLQQQDGIQSAILHCKRSYNSPSQGCQVLSRSGSAPSYGPRISIEDEEKRSSI